MIYVVHAVVFNRIRMSKQSSLFNFMSRNDKDTTKSISSNGFTAPVKSTGKFKFNTKSSSRVQTNTDENRPLNTIGSNAKNFAAKFDDCVIISDEDSISPIKNRKAKKMDDSDDDMFAASKSPDFSFKRASTLVSSESRTMEDILAKYGSPEIDNKSKFDSLDIDKTLNSNASYVNAMKKLDENMEILRTSPKKPVGTSKFKFNTRSKPATGQNTTQISAPSLSSTNSSFTFSSGNKSTLISPPILTSSSFSRAISSSIQPSSSAKNVSTPPMTTSQSSSCSSITTTRQTTPVTVDSGPVDSCKILDSS